MQPEPAVVARSVTKQSGDPRILVSARSATSPGPGVAGVTMYGILGQ